MHGDNVWWYNGRAPLTRHVQYVKTGSILQLKELFGTVKNDTSHDHFTRE